MTESFKSEHSVSVSIPISPKISELSCAHKVFAYCIIKQTKASSQIPTLTKGAFTESVFKHFISKFKVSF